jgi:hypothetical protein
LTRSVPGGETIKIIRALDHPVLFVLFMTAAVMGMASLIKWGAHETHMFGLKAALPN